MIRLGMLFFSTVCLVPTVALSNALEIVPGRWGYDPDSDNVEAAHDLACNTDPLEIEISEDGKSYQNFRIMDQYHTADILGSGDRHITLQYHEEERTMRDNELQIWTLLLVEDDMFVWVLGEPGDFQSGPSEPRYRCKDDMS